MKLFKWANEKAKRLSSIEIKMFAWLGVFIGLMLAKIPYIAGVNIWWWVVPAVLLDAWILYVFFFRKK